MGPKPSAGDLPHPGIKSRSVALWASALPSETPGKPKPKLTCAYKKRKFRYTRRNSNTEKGSLVQRKNHVRTQCDTGHLQVKEGGLRRNEACGHLNFELIASTSVRKEISVV